MDYEKIIATVIGTVVGILIKWLGDYWFLKSPKLVLGLSVKDNSFYAGGHIGATSFHVQIAVNNFSKNTAYGFRISELKIPDAYDSIVINNENLSVPITETSPIKLKYDLGKPKDLAIIAGLAYSMKVEYFNEVGVKYKKSLSGKISVDSSRPIKIGW